MVIGGVICQESTEFVCYHWVWSQQCPFPAYPETGLFKAVFSSWVPMAKIMVLSHLSILHPTVSQSAWFSLSCKGSLCILSCWSHLLTGVCIVGAQT